jgi:hypothetical protein
MAAKITKEQANKVIADKLDQVKALLAECSKLADEAHVSFKFHPVDKAEYGLARDPGFEDPLEPDYNEPARWVPIDDRGWVPSNLDC